MSGQRWPQVRAGAIALVIALGLIDGCPLPPPAYVKPWQAPIVDAIRPIQRAVLWPVEWLGRGLVITQRWALFQIAPRDRYRLEVSGRRGAEWILLFRAGDPAHRAYAQLLLDERVRGAWNPTDRAAPQLGSFATWFLGQVLADHPELSAARLQFERIAIEDGEVHGTGTFVMPIEKVR